MTNLIKILEDDDLELLKKELKYSESSQTHNKISNSLWKELVKTLFKRNSINCIKFFVGQGYDFSEHDLIVACIERGYTNSLYKPLDANPYCALLDYAIKKFKIDVNGYSAVTGKYGKSIITHNFKSVLRFPDLALVYINNGVDVLMPVIKGVAAVETVDFDKYLEACTISAMIDCSETASISNLIETHALVKEQKKIMLEKIEIEKAIIANNLPSNQKMGHKV